MSICFMGPSPKAPFDIAEVLALEMLAVETRERLVWFVDGIVSGFAHARQRANAVV